MSRTTATGEVARHLARHIVSWYAGVHVDEVARAERVRPEVVRTARLRAGRGADWGLTREETCVGGVPPAGQLSLAAIEQMMRSNRSPA